MGLDRPVDHLPAASGQPYQRAPAVVRIRPPFDEPCLDEAVEALRHSARGEQGCLQEVGGEALARSASVLRDGGRLVSVAEEPAKALRIDASYFVVEHNREHLGELARLVDAGAMRPAIDSVFRLAQTREAFERSLASGKRGKIVIRVSDESAAA